MDCLFAFFVKSDATLQRAKLPHTKGEVVVAHTQDETSSDVGNSVTV